jgi:hypothetical protein
MNGRESKQKIHAILEDYGIPVADVYGMAIEAGIDKVQRRKMNPSCDNCGSHVSHAYFRVYQIEGILEGVSTATSSFVEADW